MITLYILCIISIVFGGEVNDNGDENFNKQNTTTLFPVRRFPFLSKDPKVHENDTKVDKSNDEQTDIASSKRDRYTQTDPEKFKAYKTNETDKPIVLNSNESKISDMDKDKVIVSKEDKRKSIPRKEGTTWKVDATYAPSKLFNVADDESQAREIETKDSIKDFKPSPHLGSFYDEDNFVVTTPVTEASFTPYKPPSFGSFEKDFYKLNYKRPVDSYQTPIDTPYRFENVPRTADWNTETGLEPRPTMEPSEKIPAGGLYKLPDAFQDKPSSDGNNSDFGLEFKDQKDNSVKKRGNPWKDFLHMVTALVPVGLIVSALTPSVITLESTSNNNKYYPSRVKRRASPPRISEQCKRRLLCEIHADQNYISNRSLKRKPCYKLRCENPQALNEVLTWLLEHHHPNHQTDGYRPADHDRRGYITRN